MLTKLQWLALEVKYLDRTQAFYEAFLDLSDRRESEHETALAAGNTDLILREPSGVPRGGLHTHYAFSIPAEEYETWYERLDERFDLVEHTFGDSRSLYFYDPETNCVELGQSAVDGPGIDGIFEVVLEVESLDRAQTFYERLGLEVTDTGDQRSRVRLTTGEFDIELWEPQLGLADARGGVHVDIGIEAESPADSAAAVSDMALDIATPDAESAPETRRIRDPDGHYVTLVQGQ